LEKADVAARHQRVRNRTEETMPAPADGAASLVLLSAGRAKALGAKPMAKVLGFGITAGNPRLPRRRALRSMEKALKSSGIGNEKGRLYRHP
jgi:acetyl-CoA acetyltransferase